MINSYTNTIQTVVADGLLEFTTNRILTGCTATPVGNGQTFQLNKPGYYYVTFNGVASATTTVGEIVVGLRQNDVIVPGATAAFTPAAVDETGNLSFATIIKVAPSCCAIDNKTNISVINTGVDATFTNANLNITKLC